MKGSVLGLTASSELTQHFVQSVRPTVGPALNRVFSPPFESIFGVSVSIGLNVLDHAAAIADRVELLARPVPMRHASCSFFHIIPFSMFVGFLGSSPSGEMFCVMAAVNREPIPGLLSRSSAKRRDRHVHNADVRHAEAKLCLSEPIPCSW
jgi:hypothetical protein